MFEMDDSAMLTAAFPGGSRAASNRDQGRVMAAIYQREGQADGGVSQNVWVFYHQQPLAVVSNHDDSSAEASAAG